jgi:hypothetical protein
MSVRLRRSLALAAAALALAGVFAAYLRPDFVFAVATQAWACF